MENINKLSLPVTLLLTSLILGGIYYLVETNKQNSIEEQQEIKMAGEELTAKKEAFQRSMCASQAEETAIEYYKSICGVHGIECKEGRYLVANYENAYKICLQGFGLDK